MQTIVVTGKDEEIVRQLKKPTELCTEDGHELGVFCPPDTYPPISISNEQSPREFDDKSGLSTE